MKKQVQVLVGGTEELSFTRRHVWTQKSDITSERFTVNPSEAQLLSLSVCVA